MKKLSMRQQYQYKLKAAKELNFQKLQKAVEISLIDILLSDYF
jgi:hypothetical protein